MKKFAVEGKVWRYQGEGAWHFVYVNEKLSKQIRDFIIAQKKTRSGFIRIEAKLGKTSWNTSLFPTKDGPYLLAIKASVRHAESIDEGDAVKVSCTFL